MTGRNGDGRDLQPAPITATLICAAPAASLIHKPDLPPALGSPIAKWSVAVSASAITAALVSHRLITVGRSPSQVQLG